MTSVLDQPVRVDRKAERLYYFDGRVSVDLNGSEAERKAVLAFLAQAQAMGRMLRALCADRGINKADAETVLRDAGVMSDRPLESEGT